jgi:hypothetical protein
VVSVLKMCHGVAGYCFLPAADPACIVPHCLSHNQASRE